MRNKITSYQQNYSQHKKKQADRKKKKENRSNEQTKNNVKKAQNRRNDILSTYQQCGISIFARTEKHTRRSPQLINTRGRLL
jgi:hypothetical protein